MTRKSTTTVGPFRVLRAELPRRDGGTDAIYDILYTTRADTDPTSGILITAGASADEALARIREIVMTAAEVHRMIRDEEDP